MWVRYQLLLLLLLLHQPHQQPYQHMWLCGTTKLGAAAAAAAAAAASGAAATPTHDIPEMVQVCAIPADAAAATSSQFRNTPLSPLCTPSPSRPDITSRSGTNMCLSVAMLAQCITAQRFTPFYRIDCDPRSFQVASAQNVVGSKPTPLSKPAVRS